MYEYGAVPRSISCGGQQEDSYLDRRQHISHHKGRRVHQTSWLGRRRLEYCIDKNEMSGQSRDSLIPVVR